MEYILILIFIIGVLQMGWFSRMNGGGWPSLPFGLDAIILSSNIVAPLFLFTENWIACLIAFAFCMLGIRTGHGQYMTLPYSVKKIEAEKVDPLLLPFFGEDPRVIPTSIQEYGGKKLAYRNFAGLALTGGLVMLGVSGVLFYYNEPLWASMALLAGMLKSEAYALGWAFFNGTPTGEFLRGIFLGLFTYAFLLTQLTQLI